MSESTHFEVADTAYRLTLAPPSAEAFVTLRAVAGMGERSLTAARAGLPGSLWAVTIHSGDALVAMGRVVGDGGLNYEIVDIAVHPDHQRRGLGRRVMEALMTPLRAEAPATAYVSLIADGGSPALYAEFGFEPTAPVSIGMALKL